MGVPDIENKNSLGAGHYGKMIIWTLIVKDFIFLMSYLSIYQESKKTIQESKYYNSLETLNIDNAFLDSLGSHNSLEQFCLSTVAAHPGMTQHRP